MMYVPAPASVKENIKSNKRTKIVISARIQAKECISTFKSKHKKDTQRLIALPYHFMKSLSQCLFLESLFAVWRNVCHDSKIVFTYSTFFGVSPM